MEQAQREVVKALLDGIFNLGLIPEFTYSQAVELTYSKTDFPDFFQARTPDSPR